MSQSTETGASSAIIEARQTWKVYRRRRVEVEALRGVDLSVAAGEMIAIVGPSGSGKSTLLHLLGALDAPSRGELRILGQNVATMNDDQLAAFRRQRMGFVFQFFNLLPSLTALENAALPLLLDGRPRDECFQRAGALLERVGLSARADHRPDELSGGQQQRVALARALVSKPALLLADEPTGNLDSAASAEVLDLIDQVRRESGLTVVLVTHDDSIAARAPRLLSLRDGLIERDERRATGVGA